MEDLRADALVQLRGAPGTAIELLACSIRKYFAGTKNTEQEIALCQIRDSVLHVLPAENNLAGQQKITFDRRSSRSSNKFPVDRHITRWKLTVLNLVPDSTTILQERSLRFQALRPGCLDGIEHISDFFHDRLRPPLKSTSRMTSCFDTAVIYNIRCVIIARSWLARSSVGVHEPGTVLHVQPSESHAPHGNGDSGYRRADRRRRLGCRADHHLDRRVQQPNPHQLWAA